MPLSVHTTTEDDLKVQALEFLQERVNRGDASIPEICTDCGMYYPPVDGMTPLLAYFYRGFLPQFWNKYKWICESCLDKLKRGPTPRPWYIRVNLPPPPPQ